MTKTNPPTAFPRFLRNTRRVLGRMQRSASFFLVMALAVTLLSILGNRGAVVIVHDHESTHLSASHDLDHAAATPHEDHHHDEHGRGDDGHHHHLSSSSYGLMMALPQAQHQFFHPATSLTYARENEICPDGPVFALIKPPQLP